MMRTSRIAATLALAILTALPVGAWGLALPGQPSVEIDPEFLASLQVRPDALFEAFLVLDGPVSMTDVGAIVATGFVPLRAYEDWGIVFGVGTGKQVLAAVNLESVRGVHENRELQFFGNTATVASRAREAWDSKSTSTSPVLTPAGALVNGAGSTVVVIDSGIDGTHPDLAAAVVANLKYVCTTPGLVSTASDTCFGNSVLIGTPCPDNFWRAAVNTDTTSGHGSHVAGIVAGRGVASDGRFMGAAPGARLIGLSTGEGLSILFAMEAFAWVDCWRTTYGIDVINNSWGLLDSYSATDPINVAVTSLVGDGVVVVFAAGNDGGAGGDEVNAYARNPTQGVISVANYDDADMATRTGALDASSSRCASSTSGAAVSRCPDVSAPGAGIVSTRASTGAAVDAVGHPLSGDGRFLCCTQSTLDYSPYYVGISGTSMAAPHVAGVVALLLQADPTLTPADVEDILEDTANQFTTPGGYGIADSSNPTNNLNHGSGHGLVDAIAALEDMRVLGGSGLGSPLPQLSQSPRLYTEGLVDVQLLGGVPPTMYVQWTALAGRPVELAERFLASGNTADWPIALGDSANFRITGPASANLATTLTADGSDLQMGAAYTFTTPGTYTVEAQIDFGTFVSFDSFKVRIV